jgi:hypothetical protein
LGLWVAVMWGGDGDCGVPSAVTNGPLEVLVPSPHPGVRQGVGFVPLRYADWRRKNRQPVTEGRKGLEGRFQ